MVSVMRKFIKIIQSILPAFAAYLIMSLISIMLYISYSFFVSLFTHLRLKNQGIDKTIIRSITEAIVVSEQVSYIIGFIAVLLSAIVFLIWYIKLVSGRRFIWQNQNHIEQSGHDMIKCRLKRFISTKSILCIIILGIGCQMFVSSVLSLIQPFMERLFVEYGETISSIFVGNPVIVALYVLIVAPVMEELLFRGLLLYKLRGVVSFIWANIIQAAIFGIYHMDVIQGFYAFGLGILLGFVCYKFRTIFASILLHIAINLAGYIMGIILLPSTLIYFVITAIMGLGIILLSILWILKMTYSEKEQNIGTNPN